MPGALLNYLAADHDRLEQLLHTACADASRIDMDLYGQFRKGLLRHIGIEEKIVLPAIARLNNGLESPDAKRIRLDHGALVALMVPPPDEGILRGITSILAVHNVLEEGESGIYHLLDRLAGQEEDDLYRRMSQAPEVPVLPHNPSPGAREAAGRALQRAGYTL